MVKTVHRAASGLRVKFEHASHQEMTTSCTPTNRIVQIRPDGTVQYYMNCRETGLITVNDTPDEVAIPIELADGIAPGAAMTFCVNRSRIAHPIAAFADKLKKRLVNYHGFGL